MPESEFSSFKLSSYLCEDGWYFGNWWLCCINAIYLHDDFFISCSLESVGRRPAGSQFYFHTYSKRLLILINHHLHCLILLVYLVFNRVLVFGLLVVCISV